MTSGKEWKLILLFALPIIAGTFLQQLYNVIDGIVVGNYVSETAFASVTTCMTLTTLYLSLATGLSVGAGVVISQYYGAGKNDELPVAIDTALLLIGFCGLMLSITGILFSPFLLRNLLNVPETILPLSVTYMRIYSAGLFFQFLYNGIAATLRSFGDSKATLYFLLTVMALNTAMTLLFVIIFKWGVAGAASATVLAQIACAAVSYAYLRRRFTFVKAGRHWDKKIAATMTRLGLPVALQYGVIAVGGGTLQRLVNGFNDTVPGIVAAYGAGIRIDMLTQVPIMGFHSGLASFSGQNIGAGRLDRVKRGFHSTMVMSLIATVTLCVLFVIFAKPIVGFFGLEQNSLNLGAEMLKFMSSVYWVFSIYMSVGGLLQGAGDTLLLSSATLTALVARVSLGYLSVHFGILGYNAAWIPHPIGWFLAAVIVYTRYFTGGWKHKAVAGNLKRE